MPIAYTAGFFYHVANSNFYNAVTFLFATCYTDDYCRLRRFLIGDDEFCNRAVLPYIPTAGIKLQTQLIRSTRSGINILAQVKDRLVRSKLREAVSCKIYSDDDSPNTSTSVLERRQIQRRECQAVSSK